jgi:hypothetical protein
LAGGKHEPSDFVKWLESQLAALRARQFDNLDVDKLAEELEGVVGRCRREIEDRPRRLIPILMRPYDVYGDWTDLHEEWQTLLSALKDSPSLSA